ncbi:MAG: hypothetical protein R6U57_06815 [Anaerolineales bacterium]
MGKNVDQIRGVALRRWFFLSLVVLLILVPACRPREDVVDESKIETKVAQTIAAQQADEKQPDTDTPQPPPPSLTPTIEKEATPTLTPTMTHTPTQQAVRVHVTGDTFCRTGTGNVYEGLGILYAAQETEILAKDPTGEFWYITLPDDPEVKCWIWGKYATPEGPVMSLPVFTPPPKPSYYVSYEGSECGTGQCKLWFVVENTGPMDLESYSLHVESKSTAGGQPLHKTEATNKSNTFYTSVMGSQVNKIHPGKKAYIVSGVLDNPIGYQATTTITVCSQDNQAGMCVTQVLTFTVE